MTDWPETRRTLLYGAFERPVEGDGLHRLFRPERLSRPAEVWLAEVRNGTEPGHLDGMAVCWRDLPEDTEEERGGAFSPDQVDDAGILNAFGRLVDAPPDAYLAFAQRYVPLELCAHGLPFGHNALSATGGMVREGEPLGSCDWLRVQEDRTRPSIFYCPVETWRSYARQVQAALDLGAALHAGKPGGEENWSALLAGPTSPFRWLAERWGSLPPWLHQDGTMPGAAALTAHRARRWDFLTGTLDRWLEVAGVRPVLRRDTPAVPGPPQLAWGDGGVFGAVVRQVVFIVMRTDGLAICAGCGTAFVPSRRPARGRKSWCSDCSGKVADRDRQARRRARRRRES